MGLALPCMRVGAVTPRLAEAPLEKGPCSCNTARGALLRDSFAVIKHSITGDAYVSSSPTA
jgi:hypothetical protein